METRPLAQSLSSFCDLSKYICPFWQGLIVKIMSIRFSYFENREINYIIEHTYFEKQHLKSILIEFDVFSLATT